MAEIIKRECAACGAETPAGVSMGGVFVCNPCSRMDRETIFETVKARRTEMAQEQINRTGSGKITFVCREPLNSRLREYCEAKGLDMTTVIQTAVVDYLDARDK